MADHVPTIEAIPYGTTFDEVLDYYQNPSVTPVAGGRPWILICPSEGYVSGSRYTVRDEEDEFLADAERAHWAVIEFFLTNAGGSVPFDVFVADVKDSNTNVGGYRGGTGWGERQRVFTIPAYWPENVQSFGRAFQWIKQNVDKFPTGLAAERGGTWGWSAGSVYSMLCAYRPDMLQRSAGGLGIVAHPYSYQVSSAPAWVGNWDATISFNPSDFNVVSALAAFWGAQGNPADFPTSIFDACSIINFVTPDVPPTISFYDDLPSGGKPYNAPHDQGQAVELHAALDAEGVTNEWHLDTTNPPGILDAVNLQRLYDFAVSVLGL